ncbi:PD-(D/E)XK nuclease family protein [uncultured Methanospirillum sp.]|uniref:PD-(D/E)XK nuclease family protein n=1 Tax=uncultured Methanospirillum sp. TaxID=262503 RepID=UPI0029C68D9B|nr:PD-(D/E)XK nuclease family protein [uncultured Methanospirillum sp.]
MTPGSDESIHPLLADLADFSPSSDRNFLFVQTNHLVRAIQDAYVRTGTPILPDQITTLREFCRRHHENSNSQTTLISDGQSLQLLSETLETIREDIPFFFSRHNPAPTTLKDLLALRDILSQRRIAFFESEQIRNSEKCRQINLALEAYSRALEQRGLTDATGLIEWTISAIDTGLPNTFGTVRFRGFHKPLPREKELIRAIRDHAEHCVYQYPTGRDQSIYDIPDWFGDGITPMDEPPLSKLFTGEEIRSDEGISIGIFQSPREELESIAEEICYLHESGVSLHDITVVTPDISSHALITGIFQDFGISSQISAGEALNREPLVGFFTLFPSLVADNFPREDLMSLMASPFFRSDQPDIRLPGIGVVDMILRRARIMEGPSWDRNLEALAEGSEGGSNGETGEAINPTDLAAVRGWIERFQTDLLTLRVEQTLSEHVTVFRQILDHWVRPGFIGKPDTVRVSQREKRAWERFDLCLTRLSALSEPGRKIGVGSFSRYLNYLLEELVTISEDQGGVTVMRLSETAYLHLPYLFLAGLVEGDIPRPSTRLPLLTAAESDLLGGRSLSEVISGEQYSFISAISAGDQVYLSAPRSRGEKIQLTSPFLEEVRHRLNPPEWGRVITRSKSHAAMSAGRLIAKGTEASSDMTTDTDEALDRTTEKILDLLSADQTYGSVADRILMEDWYRTGVPDSPYDGVLSDDQDATAWLTERFGPAKVWAPTRLETYATCPFRFFLQQVLRLSPLPDVDPALTPAQRGNFIHDTLCDFFRQWSQDGPRQITRQYLAGATDLLKEIGIEKSRRYTFTTPAWHATLLSLFGDRDQPGLFDRFLACEAAREETTLLPGYFECEIGAEKAGDDSGNRNGENAGTVQEEESSTGEISGEDRRAEERSWVLLDQGDEEPVRISGRIDRVDLSRDGYFAIIDYKTGSSYPNAKGIREGTALQLPLYLLALEKMHEDDETPLTGIAGSYCEISRKVRQSWPLLNPDHKSLVGAGNGRATTGFRDILMNSLDAARTCISHIRSGRFPLPETCQVPYCEYTGICRFNRFRISDSGEES